MSLLDTKELEQMRHDVEKLLPGKCNVLAITRTPDGTGGFSETRGTALHNVKCRCDSLGGKEVQMGLQITPYHGYIFTLPWGADISEQNLIQFDGSTFEVLAVDLSKSWGITKRALTQKE